MFSRSRNPLLTFLLSYDVWLTSKIHVNFRFETYWWICHEVREFIADISIQLPCLGDLENPGRLPVQHVLEGTGDCACRFWHFSTIYVFKVRESFDGIPTELPCLGDVKNSGHLPVQDVFELTQTFVPWHKSSKFISSCMKVAGRLNDQRFIVNSIVMSCIVKSCHVMPRHVTPCHVMSRHVTSCHIMSCHIMSFHVMPRHVTSCYVMLRHATSCYVMSRHVTSCHVMSRHVMSCHVMSRHFTSCHVMPRHATPCRVMSRQAMSRHVMWRHVMSLHVTSCRASVVLWLTISPPRWETPGLIPTSTKKIHDIYGAIWGMIVFSCNSRCLLIFLHGRSRTYRVASLRAGPVGRISYSLYFNCKHVRYVTCDFNKRIYISHVKVAGLSHDQRFFVNWLLQARL